MSPAYDATCPACETSVPEGAERTCCGRCLDYHHTACWTGACGACGSTATLADKNASRRQRRSARVEQLLGLAFVDVIAWALAFLFTVPIPIDEGLYVDGLWVVAFALLLPVVFVLARGR